MCAEYVTRNLSVYEKALPGSRYDYRGEPFHKHSGECLERRMVEKIVLTFHPVGEKPDGVIHGSSVSAEQSDDIQRTAQKESLRFYL